MRNLIIFFVSLIHPSLFEEVCSQKNLSLIQNQYFSNGDCCGVTSYCEPNRNFQVCCNIYSAVIEKDLKPYQPAITKSMVNEVRDRGTKYQIIQNKLYRQRECMFPSRCAGIEHFIKKFIHKLSDMELIINCRDWPQIHKHFGKRGPVLSFSKTNEYMDILYPTWGFWEGGPAISLYPTGLGRWDKHQVAITTSAKKWPWKNKLNKGFFRGSRTSDERDSLILLSRKRQDLVDAQYTRNQAWKSPKDTLNEEPAEEVPFEEHCQFKYLFNFRGVAASFRFKHLFMCKSLVLHVGDQWREFFYDALIPWIHYIPIKSYPSEQELEKAIKYFQMKDNFAKEIAKEGYRFISKYLRLEDVDCYWLDLLQKYGKLIKYKVELEKEFIEVS